MKGVDGVWDGSRDGNASRQQHTISSGASGSIRDGRGTVIVVRGSKGSGRRRGRRSRGVLVLG